MVYLKNIFSIDGSTRTKKKIETITKTSKYQSDERAINGNKYEFGFDARKSPALKVELTTPNVYIQRSLQEHNRLRAKHHSPPLKINYELCKIAQGWANRLAKEEKQYHSKYEFGENIYWCTVDKPAEHPVKRWYDEIEDWDWEKLAGPGTGHFTQVIWKRSKELGVAVAFSKDGHLTVVAEYNPPGNFVGHYGDNVLPE